MYVGHGAVSDRNSEKVGAASKLVSQCAHQETRCVVPRRPRCQTFMSVAPVVLVILTAAPQKTLSSTQKGRPITGPPLGTPQCWQ